MYKELYEKAKSFKKMYPSTIAWRLKAHAKVAAESLNSDEIVDYVFVAQKNDKVYDIASTNIVVLTNQRILICSKRVLFGYFSTSIQRYMFNDLTVKKGIVWGRIYIDTIKEFVPLSNISKAALIEIESKISEHVANSRPKNNSGNQAS